MFKPAQRKQAKLRLALSGPSGSGKTTGALLVAKGLGGRIAVVDTERGSASLYSDLVPFDVVELGPPYTPERYIEIIHEAEQSGYDTLILDSITHEWNGSGGILEIVDAAARAKYRGNSYAAWGEGTPRHQKFVDAMLASRLHIIATMRSKSVYVETEKANGKKSMEKQGAAPQQRDGLEYEFTAVLDLTIDGNFANASKDRTRLFRDPLVISDEVGHRLRAWLESGAVLDPESASMPAQSAPHNIPEHLDLDGIAFELTMLTNSHDFVAYWNQQRVPSSHAEYGKITALFARRKQEILALEAQTATGQNSPSAGPNLPHAGHDEPAEPGTEPCAETSPEYAPASHVSLADARFEFMASNTPENLKATAQRLAVVKDNPDYPGIIAAYKERMAELTNAPVKTEKLTADQRKAIQASYSQWNRQDRLDDITQRLGRVIASVNDLTRDEASRLLESFNTAREAAA